MIPPTEASGPVRRPSRFRGEGNIAAIRSGSAEASRKRRWFDWIGPGDYEELMRRFDENECATDREKVEMVDEFQRRHEPAPAVLTKARELLGEAGWSSLRARMMLRLSRGVGVFHRIGDRLDPVLVAIRLGIELAASGELLHAEAGSLAVLKFLQAVGCYDLASERNRVRLSQMLAAYRHLGSGRMDSMFI